MNCGFDFEGVLNFTDNQQTAPDVVISEMGRQLEKATRGFVKAEVSEYDGPIESADITSTFASLAASLGTAPVRKDIQQDLGEIGYCRFKYEFYLSSSELENYKYRILFFEFGMSNYPVKIVLEQGIADEIFGEENADYEIQFNSKEELENAIEKIINSQKVIKVMQNLINTAQRVAGNRVENSSISM